MYDWIKEGFRKCCR